MPLEDTNKLFYITNKVALYSSNYGYFIATKYERWTGTTWDIVKTKYFPTIEECLHSFKNWKRSK